MINPLPAHRTSILGPKGLPIAFFIRDIRIEPAIVMAPMEGVTNVSFRRFIRQIGGVGLSTTEFIPSSTLRTKAKRVLEQAKFDTDEHPISIQIYGRDPEIMADAARVIQDLGADICDINMGCPSKKVCAHSGGSALMKDPKLAAEIVSAVRAAISIPLTVKMRAGFDAGRRNAPALAKICESEGAELITIHWRTREDRYSGNRNVDIIAEAKSNVTIPVVANGDIVDVESMIKMYEQTRCDGFMVGRGMLKNPWCIKQMAAYLVDQPQPKIRPVDRKNLLLNFLARYEYFYRAERPALGKFKQLAKYFAMDMPDGELLRKDLLRAQRIEDIRTLVNEYFQKHEDVLT